MQGGGGAEILVHQYGDELAWTSTKDCEMDIDKSLSNSPLKKAPFFETTALLDFLILVESL